jgi:hypothetical protein
MIKWFKKLKCEFELRCSKKYIDEYMALQNDRHNLLFNYREEYRKDKQELWGHIHILEEQQEIMHNFLVEINKYLVNLVDKEKK